MKEINITMDGHAVTLDPCSKTYEELVRMHYSFFPAQPVCDPLSIGINFIITYKDGPKSAPTGTVLAGQDLSLTDGMAIKVVMDREQFKTRPA